ncbi:minor capsid protein [Campylobacter sp. RM12920]|uniref:Minor capsid protein n=1 Tax=Campylobacter californiensis TaxID=1032243 RepID=A0ABD4JGZ4_9BACT|nr:minor capsid protein [Campylobacter sp. RM12919]MBE2987433.1 minor capsid protein [Campylobacter sp. RM12920]
MSVNISFFAKPENVVKFLHSRRPEIHFDYDEIMYEAHNDVFTVAKITKLDLLKDIKDSLQNAYENGLDFKEWKQNVKPILAKKGWLGDVSVTNPRTGEVKQIYVGSRRLKRIFNTNMRVSYAKARYESQMSSHAPYFRYVAVLDGRTRAGHRALHGLILPKTHKFWEKNYPPNDWGCRCKVQVLTQDELESEGWQVSVSAPQDIASRDWAYNVGRANDKDKILKEKISKIDKDSKLAYAAIADFKNLERDRNLYVWRQSLNRAIDELIINNDKRSPIEVFQIGAISDFIAGKVKEILNIELKNARIMADKKAILHIRPERKGKYAQALSIDEMRHIPQVLLEAKSVSVDKENMNLIYWFDDKNDGKFINKIAVDLNYTLKKFGVTNYMVTIGKVNKDDLSRQEIIKIR